jgi:hypothetical protein
MPLEVYLEYDLRTEIKHPRTHETYVVSGRADWAGAYGGRAGSETVLFCAEAKQGISMLGSSTGTTSDVSCYLQAYEACHWQTSSFCSRFFDRWLPLSVPAFVTGRDLIREQGF